MAEPSCHGPGRPLPGRPEPRRPPQPPPGPAHRSPDRGNGGRHAPPGPSSPARPLPSHRRLRPTRTPHRGESPLPCHLPRQSPAGSHHPIPRPPRPATTRSNRGSGRPCQPVSSGKNPALSPSIQRHSYHWRRPTLAGTATPLRHRTGGLGTPGLASAG